MLGLRELGIDGSDRRAQAHRDLRRDRSVHDGRDRARRKLPARQTRAEVSRLGQSGGDVRRSEDGTSDSHRGEANRANRSRATCFPTCERCGAAESVRRAFGRRVVRQKVGQSRSEAAKICPDTRDRASFALSAAKESISRVKCCRADAHCVERAPAKRITHRSKLNQSCGCRGCWRA